MHFDGGLDMIAILSGWLGFFGLRAIFGEVADFLTIVTSGPGGRVSSGI